MERVKEVTQQCTGSNLNCAAGTANKPTTAGPPSFPSFNSSKTSETAQTAPQWSCSGTS